MTRRVYSMLFWIFMATSSILLFPLALLIWAVTLPFDRRLWILHRFTCFWGSIYTWLNPAWPVTIHGREKLRDDVASVIVANHLSLLDILVLFRIFVHFKWVSKVENFRIPCIGWNMSLNRYIKLKRGNRASVMRMMAECRKTLQSGNSILMFPEGTRSPTGRMRAFKTGAFELAQATRSPIQPLIIRGTADALPKRGFVLRGRHPITVTVFDPIPPEAVEHLDAEKLTEHVRAQMAATLAEHSPDPPIDAHSS